MTYNNSQAESQDILGIKNLLHSYFPDIVDKEDASILEKIGMGEYLTTPEKIIPYLQTVFFEEHLLELQLDQTTRRFFTNILDDVPDSIDDEDYTDENGEKYETASYLRKAESVVLAPLSPPIGNGHVLSCKLVVLRFFMGTMAVELGCTFRDKDMVDGIPVLRFNFPVIGRVNRNYRAFRVKVVTGVDARVSILRPILDNAKEEIFQIEDISTMGLAFQVRTDERNFEIGNRICINIHVPELDDLEIEGMVRHISRARGNSGVQNILGMQFDLETRAMAAQIERLTAAIQRLQLREIADKTASLRGVRIIK